MSNPRSAVIDGKRYTARSLCTEFGVSIATAYTCLRERRLPRLDKVPSEPLASARLFDYYGDQLPMSEIARREGISTSVAYNRFRHGLPKPGVVTCPDGTGTTCRSK